MRSDFTSFIHIGAYFIDRDPELFRMILNFLRTQQLHLLVEESDAKQLSALIHEANFYGIAPLSKQVTFFGLTIVSDIINEGH